MGCVDTCWLRVGCVAGDPKASRPVAFSPA